MRLIKLGIISIVAVFLLVTAFSLMIPSHIRISRATNLPGPVDSVLIMVKDKSRWPTWHPVYQDPNLSQLWESMPTLVIKDSDSSYILQYTQPGRRPVINGWQVYTYTNKDSVTLQWYMDFTMSWYPWQKFSSLFYEKNYGVMMETGLGNLKHYMNKQE